MQTPGRGPLLGPPGWPPWWKVRPRVQVSYIARAGRGMPPRSWFAMTNPATGQPFAIDYDVFVDPVTAKITGRRDSLAVSLSKRSLMPLRTVRTASLPAFWGTDRWGCG
jgi:hypothetical protein